MRYLKFVFLIFIINNCNLFAERKITSSLHTMQNVEQVKMDRWVDSVFQTMSLKDKVSQFIMPIIWLSDDNSIEVAKKRLKNEKWGGILFQKTNIKTQAKATRELQQISSIPMFIALDGEWGLYMRIKDAPRFPRNMGLGYDGNEDLLYRYGKEVARQCRIMGIHIDFAPDIDVNIDPRNPVIGTRSFSSDKKVVSKCGNAFSRGLEDGGVMSVAKHFPGHGDTHVDSHKALPVIKVSKARLDSVELYPFRSYIDNGFSAVMVGHLNVPALDSSGVPSSMSKPIVTDLLKNKLGFKGLVFTDALEMQGANVKSQESAGLRAFKAGNDILLGPTNPEGLIKEICDCVKKGDIDIKDIDKRLKKILQHKYVFIVSNNSENKKVSLDKLYDAIWTDEAKDLQNTLWVRSITTLSGNVDDELENVSPQNIVNVVVGRNFSDKNASLYKSKGIKTILWDQNKESSIIKEISKYGCVIFHVSDFSKISNNSLNTVSGKTNSIIFWYGSPFELKNIGSYKKIKGIACVYESCQEAYNAVASYITDESARKKGVSKPVAKSSMTDVVALAQKGVDTGAYPGCQLFFSVCGNVMLNKSFGTKSNKNDSVTNQTIYDLASLTKALATTPAMMILVSEKKINLKDKVAKYIPAFASSPVGSITIQKLLFHESGLPSGLPFYEDLIDNLSFNYPLISNVYVPGYVSVWKNSWANPNFKFLDKYISSEKKNNDYCRFSRKLWIDGSFKDNINQRIASTKLRGVNKYRYSDLNFYLLQQIIEKVSGQPLDVFVENRIYKPLKCNLKFNPIDKGVEISDIAPAQVDDFLRKEEIRGTVDDELAACLGGVSGNAGLFGSVQDVAKVCNMFLDNGKTKDGKTIIDSKVLKEFTTKTSNYDLRFLGFDKPSKKRSSVTAESASYYTYGHTGFTGSCFWIDPQNKSIFIFISNRTYPNRNNVKLISENYRTNLQQLCYDSL